MDRPTARQIADLTAEASRLLNESITRVRSRASESAANVYHSAVGRALGDMAAGILFRVWREHPELEPPEMKGPSDYDPRHFQMSAGVADEALAALRDAADIMARVEHLVENEADPAEREAYLAELAGIQATLDDAKRGVEKRTQR